MTHKLKKSGFHFANALTTKGWQSNLSAYIDGNGHYTELVQDHNPNTLPVIEGYALPGMANLHSHAFQRAMAGLGERRGQANDSFWSWRHIMYRFVNLIEPDDLYAITSKLYIDFLKGGFTSVAEFHYLHHALNGQHYADHAEMSHAIRQAATTSGIALTHLPVFYAHAGFGGKAPNEGQRRFINDVESYGKLLEQLAAYCDHKNPLFRLGIAPHSLRAVTSTELREIQALQNAIAPSGPIHIHIAEQQQEVNDCIHFHGARPVEWLINNAPVNDRWCLVHATHVTPQELSMIVRTGATTGLCPMTEANLGDGVFPAENFVAQGGHFGIGTDSNIRTNVADELQMLEYSQRLIRQQRNVLADETSPDVSEFLILKAAKGGQKAVAQPETSFAPGSRADFQVFPLCLDEIIWERGNDFLNYWLFAALDKSPGDVYVAGKQVVFNGKHGADDKVNAVYRQTMSKLLNKL